MLTIPNAITLSRLILILPLVALTCSRQTWALGAAAALFAAEAADDWLDGFLARRLGNRTRLGTLLDPVVDKLLILSVLFVLADRGLFPLWLVLLNMARSSW